VDETTRHLNVALPLTFSTIDSWSLGLDVSILLKTGACGREYAWCSLRRSTDADEPDVLIAAAQGQPGATIRQVAFIWLFEGILAWWIYGVVESVVLLASPVRLEQLRTPVTDARSAILLLGVYIAIGASVGFRVRRVASALGRASVFRPTARRTVSGRCGIGGIRSVCIWRCGVGALFRRRP